MAKLTVVVGGQFGSEGKGAICAHLGRSQTSERDVAIRVAGPNAGHTAYDSNGVEFKLRALPVAAVVSDVCQLHIAAGSEIDIDVLLEEILLAESHGHQIYGRLTIHPSATILTQRHKEAENLLGLVNTIGSTCKGVGGARADRIMRRADTISAVGALSDLMSPPGQFELDDTRHVVIEGTQGYGLGLHTGFYPQVTSSDCRAVDFLAMAGISPWDEWITEFSVIVVARVYPIRVAGNSGPLRGETTWEDLGLPLEYTTVTKKIRRVGEPDWDLVAAAVRANGGGSYHPNVRVAVTMVDQLYPNQRDRTDLDDEVLKYLDEVEGIIGADIELVGTGPNTVTEV
jgi:adenylosuccinate synthase